ncbi:MAG TPA: DUF222 domain-containing protein [Acidimicrobiales bacterium]|nr:DUF222 domain-containing protein [Acidimicrobiales bacterium]
MLNDLTSVVDQVCDTDPAVLCDGDSIQELHRCLARLEAATTRASAAFESGGEWQADGARSASAWLARRCGLPSSTARRRMRLGRTLRHLPVAEAAWLAGELGEAQVAALARARTPATQEAMERDEETLVGEAMRLRFESFIRVLGYWCQHADPDGVEDDAASGRAARRFHLSQSFEHMWWGDLVLDPISGAILAKALSRIEDELFEADWAEARARLGDGATTSDLARTPAQRRADALVEMARRAGSAPADGRRPEPLFTVMVGYETFAGRICQLANGSVVSPGSLFLGWSRPGWSGWSSTHLPGFSTRAWPEGSSTGPPAGPCRYVTGSASTSCATNRPRTVRSTTSSPGAPAGRPWRPTGGWPVGTTTAGGTDDRSRRLDVGRRHS